MVRSRENGGKVTAGGGPRDSMIQERLIHAIYRIEGDAAEAGRAARAIAYEQTVELPEAQVGDRELLDSVVGRVEALEADPGCSGRCRARIAYRAALASGQIGQLFNLLYGNVSMYAGVRLVDVELPPELLGEFRGPRYGIAGLRELLGVHGRPLLATAAKPRGLAPEALARIVHDFAIGGGDVVKDDQNLVDATFDDFRRRVDLCAGAVERANARTGRRCLYLPHLAGHDEDLERAAEFVHARGLAGVLICPMVTGLDRARALADRYGLLFMAHPALSGAFTNGDAEGVAHGLLLGTLFRLAGADVSVFPAPGGRFAYTREQCADIAGALKRPLGSLKPALPGPAGGMRLELVPQLARDYGADALLLVGGSLLGHAGGVVAGTQAFRAALGEHFEERLAEPADGYVSACELPSAGEAGIRTLIAARAGFRWEDREDQVYKSVREADFRGVRRVELVGKNGEAVSFDLRYFELEPGGYTSLEKHMHTHVLIGARGRGVVLTGSERLELGSDDIAYIAPLAVHQLRNESAEPFGFYCIVDHERDRPMAP